jgi:hypothetical protein
MQLLCPTLLKNMALILLKNYAALFGETKNTASIPAQLPLCRQSR